jgi:hypothetical protein
MLTMLMNVAVAAPAAIFSAVASGTTYIEALAAPDTSHTIPDQTSMICFGRVQRSFC